MDYESRLRDVESGLQTEDAKLRVHQALKNGRFKDPRRRPETAIFLVERISDHEKVTGEIWIVTIVQLANFLTHLMR